MAWLRLEEGLVPGRRTGTLSWFINLDEKWALPLMSKALGLSVGGKIGIARKGDHICVAAYFAIGLLHLNDVAVGLGHRAI